MSIRRVVPNVRVRHSAVSRAFYVDVLGLQLVMDLGFIKTFASTSNPTAQVSVVDATPAQPHPDLTVEVADVDAAYTRARERGVEIVYPPHGRAMGRPALLRTGGERRRGQCHGASACRNAGPSPVIESRRTRRCNT